MGRLSYGMLWAGGAMTAWGGVFGHWIELAAGLGTAGAAVLFRKRA